MLKTQHTFKVWHPQDGFPITYVEKTFHMTYACTRTHARFMAESVEGYCIERKRRKKKAGH